MMKACVNCKHFRKAGIAMPFLGWCKHPAAQLHNRIVGSYSPRLGDLLDFVAGKDGTLTKCDENDWFEPREPSFLWQLITLFGAFSSGPKW